MKNIKLNSLVKRFVYTFLLLVGYISFAQNRPVVNPGGGMGAVGPGAVPNNPIDMYEGILLLVAVAMMVGYYLYTNKIATNA